ncbi:F-box/LRR-repeat protein At3g26922-like [Nicotiana tabacum]|uniref:F-box/LRR-repeat protein At3g26922-like n=1 Tax=Nicotiana tabacum TaxID=4097 RepID=A0AC58SJD5_TOBAC
MEEKSVDAAVDYISKLPEPILQKIMSSLLAKEAAQLSTLSKTCNSAWTSLSYLNFGYNFLYHKGDDDRWIESENITELVNIVDQIIANRQQQKISIQKFWLTLPSSEWSSYIYNWIETLVGLSIREFILSVDAPDTPFSGCSTLPEAIFAAKHLNILDLRGFKLQLPPDGIKFSSLRMLHLSKALLGKRFIRVLCESCNGLEDLTLNECHGLFSLQITRITLPKLRRVGLTRLFDLQMINIENTFIDITACKALKRLHLEGVGVTDEWLEDIFSSLPNLENLHLCRCNALKTIKITSDRLEIFDVSFCCNLINIELDTPNLRRFSYVCINQLPTLKLKVSPLLKVYLYLGVEKTLDSHWYSKLMRFLGNFKHSKAIQLRCYSEKAIVIPKDMRKNLVPPLYGTNCLHIEFRSAAENYSVLNVLDSLLWISPQLNTLCFDRRNLGLKSNLKFIYEDEKTCCASLPLKYCWRHKLKEVKMENFTCSEQQELRNYLLKVKMHQRWLTYSRNAS